MRKTVLSLSLISTYLLAGSSGAEYTIAEGAKAKNGGGIQGKNKANQLSYKEDFQYSYI